MTVAGVEVNETRLVAVCELYGIGRLMIFGSVARGTAGPTSDVDVLYELRPGRRLGWEIEDLADELSDVFGRWVDLVSRAGLHERMRAAVLAEAQPLYAA
jgi:predicted nucleotidyltransferase